MAYGQNAPSCDPLIQHEKCIYMSANKPYQIWERIVKFYFFFTPRAL